MFKTFIIFLEILFLLAPAVITRAASPTLLLSPAGGSFIVGSTFNLSVLLDTKGELVSGLEVELFFPKDKIQLSSPSVGSSLIESWISRPSFSNSDGRIHFFGEMSLSGGGVTVSKGVVLTFTFRVISPGSGEVLFGKNTKVFTAVSPTVSVLGQTAPAFLNFEVSQPLGPQISSLTHSDPEQWYRDTTAVFTWSKSPSTDTYSYSFDQDPTGFPDTTSNTTKNSVSFSNLDSGIWYFHLRQRSNDAWSGVSHFSAKIDNDPPKSFDIEVLPGAGTSEKDVLIRFSATDSLSGLDHFELKLVKLAKDQDDDNPLFFEAQSPHKLDNLEVGRYHVIIKAVDKVGNFREEFVTLNIVKYSFISWWTIAAVLGILALILGLVIFVLSRGKKASPAVFLILLLSLGILLPIGIKAQSVPPTISVAPSLYYQEEDIFYLSGAAADPNSLVKLVFMGENGEEALSVDVKSDKNGEWSIARELGLAPGRWQVKAGLAQGETYLWSEPKEFNSVLTSSLIGVLGVSYAQATVFLLAVIVLSLLFIAYFFFRVRKINNLQN